VVEFPDFLSPLKSIAKSLEIIAKAKEDGAEDTAEKSVVDQHVNKESN